MSNNKRKVTLLDILKIMFKRVRIRTLIFLVITSSATSFAWFIYNTKVTTGITAHIESWNILFTNSDNEVSQYINLTIPNLYPGMDTYMDTIDIANLGERSATVDYEVLSVRLLNTTYTAEGNITSDDLIDMLATDYPFHIVFSLANSTIDASHGTTTFTLTTTWPYESGNDTADTYWGNLAYSYLDTNPGSPCVAITVRISAYQSTT